MNPMQLIQLMQNNNPLMQRALQMGQGKSEDELKQIVLLMAENKGMNREQLASYLMQFGLKL